MECGFTLKPVRDMTRTYSPLIIIFNLKLFLCMFFKDQLAIPPHCFVLTIFHVMVTFTVISNIIASLIITFINITVLRFSTVALFWGIH